MKRRARGGGASPVSSLFLLFSGQMEGMGCVRLMA